MSSNFFHIERAGDNGITEFFGEEAFNFIPIKQMYVGFRVKGFGRKPTPIATASLLCQNQTIELIGVVFGGAKRQAIFATGDNAQNLLGILGAKSGEKLTAMEQAIVFDVEYQFYVRFHVQRVSV